MTIEALIAAVPPPDQPFGFEGPWGPIEAELGTPLPQDYKDFVRIYGHGYFMQFLGVTVPRSSNGNTRLEKQVPLVSKIFAEFDPPDDRPYPMWPTPGGLIPFGATDNGDYLFWLSRGPPEDWPVVVWDRGLGKYELLECSLTGFLAGLATGEILPKEFPEDLLPNECLFKPKRPLVWVPDEYRASARIRLSPGAPNPFRSRR
jgi:hypothetical protein